MKTVDFSETIAACDLKVGRCKQLIELRKVKKVKVIPEKNPVRLISMKPRPRCLQYQWSSGSIGPLSVVCHPSTLFKHLLLGNRLADQSQILCGASLGRGKESLYKWSRSHDQDGHFAHIRVKPLKIIYSGTGGPISTKLGM